MDKKIRSGDKGERSTRCGFGSAESGWLGGRASFLCYHNAKQIGDDYHRDMYAAEFNQWLKDTVVPLLPDRSVDVVNCASYHLVRTHDHLM